MPDKVKSPILIGLILISLSLAGGFFYLLEKEKARSLALQEELDDTKIKRKIAEERLEELKKTISALELKLKEAQTQVDTLTQDLEQEKLAKQEALTRIDQVKADLEQQIGLKSDLENKLTLAQEDIGKLRAQIKDLESKKAELEVKINERQAKSQGVELGTIVVSPEVTASTAASGQAPTKSAVQPQPQESAHSSGVEGKVLVVNKDYDFMVINLGSKDGIGLGDIFSVYHENKYIGDVKVEKLHDSMSAAGFLSLEIKHKVSEGDKVAQKIK